MSASKYISLQSENKDVFGKEQENERFQHPTNPFADTSAINNQKKRASTINPSLLEKLIKDSPASNGTHSFITREKLT